MEKMLPDIPDKRYFTIGEVGSLCDVKPYVLRYWEQEFSQLRPMKRRGNRRYYQRHEVLLIRRIRDLLYADGFTISGARNRLGELAELPQADRELTEHALLLAPQAISLPALRMAAVAAADDRAFAAAHVPVPTVNVSAAEPLAAEDLRMELLSIRDLLGP